MVVLYLWLQVGAQHALCMQPSLQFVFLHAYQPAPSSATIHKPLALLCTAQVARAVLLLVCWVPFNYTGYPLTWRSAAVIIWGGLRGAVGMVMALFICECPLHFCFVTFKSVL